MRKGSKVRLATLALAGLAVVMSSGAYAMCNEMKVSSLGGLNAWHSENGEHWFKLKGIMQMDHAMVGHRDNNADKGFPSGANIRRARLGVNGGVGCHWSYDMSLNFDSASTVGTSDPNFFSAFIAYEGFDNTKIVIGQNTLYTFMAQQGATRNRITMELPMPTSALYAGDGLGIGVEHRLETLTFALGVATPGDGVPAGQGGTLTGASQQAQSDLATWHGRITFSPVHTPEYVLHFGASGMYQNLHDKSGTLTFSSMPEIQARDGHWATASLLLRSTTTGSWSTGYDQANTRWSAVGLEAAGLWGPLTVQTEYVGVTTHRRAATAPADSPKYKGWYATVAYLLTGESREYDFAGGVFGAVKPHTTCGAWELFAQYSSTSLRYRNLGPVAQISTAGVNWYANQNVRLTAQYMNLNLGRLDTAATTVAGPAQRKLNVLGLRAQAAWF